jgi:hypothetical protein
VGQEHKEVQVTLRVLLVLKEPKELKVLRE